MMGGVDRLGIMEKPKFGQNVRIHSFRHKEGFHKTVVSLFSIQPFAVLELFSSLQLKEN